MTGDLWQRQRPCIEPSAGRPPGRAGRTLETLGLMRNDCAWAVPACEGPRVRAGAPRFDAVTVHCARLSAATVHKAFAALAGFRRWASFAGCSLLPHRARALSAPARRHDRTFLAAHPARARATGKQNHRNSVSHCSSPKPTSTPQDVIHCIDSVYLRHLGQSFVASQ